MIHLPELIQDLGFILATAAVVTLICKKLKQPVVLGYLIAGFLLGPHVSFMPTIKDVSAVKIWAEIGVIILLFGLGLEFSFKKLAQVGKTASITALFEVIFMVSVGYVAGQILGWKPMDSLFLGGILSISSTTIIVRAFDELGLKSRKFVSLVFGVLIVEDIVAILLLVLLSTVAVSQNFSGSELFFSSARLLFFLILWFVLGIYILPSLINRIRHWLNDETILVVSLGLCLLMVSVATYAGFSPALGAFIMGSLLSETREGVRIEKIIHPVRDLFAAVFFVSVGMLIDPSVLVEYKYEIILITIMTIFGKFISSALGALISGASLRHSVQMGLSLAQIGEFSFIIATLGLSLNVTSHFLYPIAVAVSAITTFTTPYLIKSADPFCHWLENRIPNNMNQLLLRYRAAVQNEGGQRGVPSLLWQAFGWRIVVNFTVVAALFLVSEKFVSVFLAEIFGEGLLTSLLLTISVLLLATPFLWAIAFGGSIEALNEEQQQRLSKLMFGVQLARGYFALNIAAVFINGFLSINSFVGISVFLIFAVLLVASRFSKKMYASIEKRFMANLDSSGRKDSAERPTLTPWDAGLAEFLVHPNSPLVGLSLMDAKLKESFGVTVALVQRGDAQTVAPDRNWIIMPQDRLFVIGLDEQLEKIKNKFEKVEGIADASLDQFFGLRSLHLEEGASLIGLSIRNCGLREKVSGVIVGIERNGQRILSPDSNTVLMHNDLIWIVGNLEKIKQLA